MKIYKIEKPYFAVVAGKDKEEAKKIYKEDVTELSKDTILEEITKEELNDLYKEIGQETPKELNGVLLIDTDLL